MGKHEAKGRAPRKADKLGQTVLKVAHHAVPHIVGLVTLHTVAMLILTKSPIALLIH